MDNKVTKDRVINHLEYDWFKYLILLTAVLFLIIFSFGRINAQRDEEGINVFFTAYNSYSNDFESSVLLEMRSDNYDKFKYGDPILSSVKLNFQSPIDENYNTLISLNGLLNSDVIIADRSFFVQDEAENSLVGFIPLDDNVLSLLGIQEDDYEFLRLDNSGKIKSSGGTRYGIRLTNLSGIKNLAQFKGDENHADIDAYLLIVANKPNALENGNRQTYFCLKKFFEKYGV